MNVDFKNNFIVSPISSLVGKSNTAVMGMDYNANHLITRTLFASGVVLLLFLDEVSEITFTALPQAKTSPLVHSAGGFTLSSLEDVPSQDQQKSFVLGVAVEEEKSKDSDQEAENKDSSKENKSESKDPSKEKTEQDKKDENRF